MVAGRIIVKFAEGSNVRLRRGKLTRETGDKEAAEEIELPGFDDVVIERYFAQDELSIEKERQDLLRTATHEQVPDLNLYYALIPSNEEQQKALCDFLNTLPLVEAAYVEEEPDLAGADSRPSEGSFVREGGGNANRKVAWRSR